MNSADFDGMDTNDLIDYTMNELDQLRGRGGANPEELEEIQELLEIIEQRYDEKDAQWQFECGVVMELKSRNRERLKNIYERALDDIDLVKKKIKGMSFEDARKALCGFNCNNEMFDYDFGCITGTVVNIGGCATIDSGRSYVVWDESASESLFEGTEYDIRKKGKTK